MYSQTEENYLKVIYMLARTNKGSASTNAIADYLDTKASSVTDMIKKLADKKLINYKKYHGSSLTKKGEELALKIIRKHRLWEVFLVEKLHFKWDEVHIIAEQLEHVQSADLTQRLDEFLGYPKFDPHGDPIPDATGKIDHLEEKRLLSELNESATGIVVGVVDTSASFLRHLEQLNLSLGTKIKVKSVFDFDKSMIVLLDNKMEHTLSQQICKNIWLKLDKE